MSNTITSANAKFALAVTNLYPTAQILEGFAADAMFVIGDTDYAITVRGADGKLSAGFVYGQYIQTITIMPDSPSRNLFETWASYSRAGATVFRCNGTINMPSIGRKFTMTNGVLLRSRLHPDAARTLQAIPYQIEWESVTGENINVA